MKETKRSCVKCGASPRDDLSITLHRFPIPRALNAARCEHWAKYVFPHRSWNTREFHEAIYKHHRMLCSKHFNPKCFIKGKLNKNALPGIDVPGEDDVPKYVALPTKPQATTEPEQDITTPGQVNKEPTSIDQCNTTPEKVNEESVADPLDVNQGYEVAVQETAAFAYSTDNDYDDDYQPSASGVSTDDEDATVSEEATRRVTRQVTSTQVEVEEASGQCWCCLKQGEHSVVNIPALLDCLNVPIEVPPKLRARVCSECESFLSRARHFRDMVVCSQQVLSDQGPVVQLDNTIEEDENATLRLEYVSETGKVQDMKVPLKDLYFDRSGHLVQYALQDNEESDDQESENEPPKETEEAVVSRVERNKRPNLQKAGPANKRQRATQNMNITPGNNQSKTHIDNRQSPGLTHKNVANVALRNSRNLNQSNVQPLEVKQKVFTQKMPKSHNVTQVIPPKDVSQTIELEMEQVDGQFIATTSNVNQSNVQLIGVKKTLKTHKISNLVQIPPISQDQTIELSIEQVDVEQSNVQPNRQKPIIVEQNRNVVKANAQPTLKLKIDQVDGQFVATTSNIRSNVALNKTEVHSPSERKRIVILQPVKKNSFPNILRRNLSFDKSIQKY